MWSAWLLPIRDWEARGSLSFMWLVDLPGRIFGFTIITVGIVVVLSFLFLFLSFCVELEHNEHARNHKISRGSVSHRHRLIS